MHERALHEMDQRDQLTAHLVGLQVSNELESEQFQSAAESNAAVFLRLAGLRQCLVELGKGPVEVGRVSR